MSNKRYYWLKLKEDFFDEDTVSWIEEQDNGKDYCLFYLKLCLKALRTNGILIRTVGETIVPYDTKKLADMTRTDVDTVRVAMSLFAKIGLIQILETGEIYLKQLSEMVGSETNKAELMRKKRALDNAGNNVTPMLPDVTKCYTEIELEKEKEKDKDKEKEREEKKKSLPRFKKPTLEEVKKYADQRKSEINPEQFIDFYTSKNWFVGKNKMVDWQGAWRTWERRSNKSDVRRKSVEERLKDMGEQV